MASYQIQFNYSDGHGEFRYFDADNREQALDRAVETANIYLNEKREHDKACPPMFYESPFRPVRTPKVVEIAPVNGSEEQYTKRDGTSAVRYDWRTKRGGHKFKLCLNYTVCTYANGSNDRAEWYSNEQPIHIY